MDFRIYSACPSVRRGSLDSASSSARVRDASRVNNSNLPVITSTRWHLQQLLGPNPQQFIPRRLHGVVVLDFISHSRKSTIGYIYRSMRAFCYISRTIPLLASTRGCVCEAFSAVSQQSVFCRRCMSKPPRLAAPRELVRDTLRASSTHGTPRAQVIRDESECEWVLCRAYNLALNETRSNEVREGEREVIVIKESDAHLNAPISAALNAYLQALMSAVLNATHYPFVRIDKAPSFTLPLDGLMKLDTSSAQLDLYNNRRPEGKSVPIMQNALRHIYYKCAFTMMSEIPSWELKKAQLRNLTARDDTRRLAHDGMAGQPWFGGVRACNRFLPQDLCDV
eukprot:IDg34t1